MTKLAMPVNFIKLSAAVGAGVIRFGIQDLRGYSGVCSHCGKTKIRYLATVSTRLADTDLDEIDENHVCEDVAADMAALLEGAQYKKTRVGVVCLVKYLEEYLRAHDEKANRDKIDTNAAQRMWALQKAVDRIKRVASYMKRRATVESLLEDEKQIRKLAEEGQKLFARRREMYTRHREEYEALRTDPLDTNRWNEIQRERIAFEKEASAWRTKTGVRYIPDNQNVEDVMAKIRRGLAARLNELNASLNAMANSVVRV